MAAPGVYRLQTEFGGGKTHTLLAAYHLFRDPQRVAGTPFVKELAGRLGRSAFPRHPLWCSKEARSPPGSRTPRCHDAQVRTLLGHLAYRLGGEAAYAKVADQDREPAGLVDDPARGAARSARARA